MPRISDALQEGYVPGVDKEKGAAKAGNLKSSLPPSKITTIADFMCLSGNHVAQGSQSNSYRVHCQYLLAVAQMLQCCFYGLLQTFVVFARVKTNKIQSYNDTRFIVDWHPCIRSG